MAFKIGTKNYVGGSAPILPLPSSTAGTSNTNGSQLFASYSNDGTTTDIQGYWAYPGNTISATFSGIFRYRSILTHGYLAGGYKGSNPWRSVNKTWHSTDTTVYCGEQLEYASAYHEGVWSDYNGYIMGSQGDTFAGSSNATTSSRTVSCNLATGMARSRGQDSYSPYTTFGFGSGANEAGGSVSTGTGDATPGGTIVGGWNASVVRNNDGAATNQVGQIGYVTGGGSTNTEKLHFPTEINYTTTASPSSSAGMNGCSGQNVAFFCCDLKRYITYSNDTWSTMTTTTGTSNAKYLSTKLGYHYGAVSTTNIQKVSDSTYTDTGTAVSKLRSYSEENGQMGQDWGYIIGQHDGQQNNHTIKFIYSNDSMYSMGSATRPKGHFGQSSAACWSAAASVTNAYAI
jgi:hypothetical protein